MDATDMTEKELRDYMLARSHESVKEGDTFRVRITGKDGVARKAAGPRFLDCIRVIAFGEFDGR